ncbi:hypothetical protein XELAEV_18011333mg [Xenopus laevis]|uniref:Uncharacterized protein n=1 Tax=Xenopus laevis TaxID=8355 RepID=A0A974DKQ0_XENLA|nr:hypothetical protein XELAEV_18011333mg [Xenopus laevis]
MDRGERDRERRERWREGWTREGERDGERREIWRGERGTYRGVRDGREGGLDKHGIMKRTGEGGIDRGERDGQGREIGTGRGGREGRTGEGVMDM